MPGMSRLKALGTVGWRKEHSLQRLLTRGRLLWGPTLALGLSQEQNDDDDDVVAPANRDEERKTEPKAVFFLILNQGLT